ncbi:hypothetical protein K493DRAFT_314091 [Basidiobolus meristosporus CBS 931.73]|uniref:P-loop containing nucleoside triphosphate hydrolase protein n=1 Tax=Basidiobolus meristosporus CBS 931.73 TaxID=1314790 RepID=A0A1Y1YHC5_9FUNG|nr:hypothetical protein K493DRAFT_314091 [Basidiobolus meristosporus CBS 931.73]|eukprot:ORX97430.1 hypothetical protein K493DRAFT_314091 [Basidiobolus meristosporus CBS 931.73]
MKAKLPLAAKSSVSNKLGMPLYRNHRSSITSREPSADRHATDEKIIDISIISSSDDEDKAESVVSRLSSIDSLPNESSNRLETYDNPDDIPPGYVYMSRHQEKKADPIVLSSSSEGEDDGIYEHRKRKPESSYSQDAAYRGRVTNASKRYRMELKNARSGRKNIRKIQAESDQVLRIRQETQRKAREVEDRIRMNQRKYEATAFTKDTIKLLINPGHDKSESDVYILPELAKFLKPHQVDGVRFMWKNVVMFNGQGCILSHAMGLGKTFQVITFLFTLMRENRLGNSTIPPKLKPNRILILCPPTLIENWHNEFYKWIPREHLRVIGWVYKLGNACKRIDEKIDFLQKWYRFGGILLMGYQAFRDLVSNQGRVVQTLEQSEEIKKILLEAPSVNPTTKISLYIKQLQTKSRICLTGYPLQNNLEEYWCMVDFVYPMFLGSLPDFRNAYINPINNGLYPDSTPGDRKLSSTKLYVLSGIISEIVLRKDASVLHRDLPEKVEYIIACKLTDLQYQLYTGFLRSQMNDAKTYTNENIIAKGHVLLQICNHPCVFKTAVVSHQDGEKGRTGVSAFEAKPKHAEAEEITIIDLENERPEELPEVQQEMKKIEPIGYDWTKELFDRVEDPADVVHCHKMNILMEILLACKKIEEKVLVFSRSIPTLDYIEHVLKRYKHQHFKYLRLDGETPIQNRQDMIDRFNQETDFDVFLISSGAGSLGVNLVSANRVVIYDVGWNPSFDEQAIARAYRYGQQRKVYVYRLQTYSTFEDKLFKNNVHKVGLFVRVVDKKNPGKLFTKDQMKRYLDFPESRPVTKLAVTQFDDPVIDQTVRTNQESIIEITLHSTLLNEVEGDLTAEDKFQAQSLLEQERRLRNPISGGNGTQPTVESHPVVATNSTNTGEPTTATTLTVTSTFPTTATTTPTPTPANGNSIDGESIPESMMPVSLNP